MSVRVGAGLDVHPFADDGRPLVLGGVEVPDAPGLAGHSDADVVAHAVTDALLGAAAGGDLGARFGVADPGVAGAASLGLLATVAAELAEDGWRLGNLDCTVVAERPRLEGYRDRMRGRLAESTRAGVEQVSVKFTTTDRLGSLGRGEGIACWAVVLVERG